MVFNGNSWFLMEIHKKMFLIKIIAQTSLSSQYNLIINK